MASADRNQKQEREGRVPLDNQCQERYLGGEKRSAWTCPQGGTVCFRSNTRHLKSSEGKKEGVKRGKESRREGEGMGTEESKQPSPVSLWFCWSLFVLFFPSVYLLAGLLKVQTLLLFFSPSSTLHVPKVKCVSDGSTSLRTERLAVNNVYVSFLALL